MHRPRLSLLVAPLLVLGCGDDQAAPRADDTIHSEPDAMVPPPVFGPCVDGDVEDCKVDLPTHNGIAQCFVGVQICSDGEWGPCQSAEE